MQSVQNILRVYHLASSGEVDAGLRWYLSAHEHAKRLSHILLDKFASVSSVDCLESAAGIIAAVSPGLRWERNIEAAERIASGEGLEGLGVRWYDGVKKAKRIIAGTPVLDVLKGNKVRAFYENIAYPKTTDKVTIDGHAWSIWAGERATLDEVPTISDKLYASIQADYVNASEVVGIRPLQLQAITWTTWRRLHKVSSAHYLPLFEE